MPSAQWELAVRSEAASLNQIMYMILFLLERGGLIQERAGDQPLWISRYPLCNTTAIFAEMVEPLPPALIAPECRMHRLSEPLGCRGRRPAGGGVERG